MNGGTEGPIWRAGIPSSASVYLCLLFHSTNAANRNSNGRLRVTSVLSPEALLVLSLSIYWYSDAFLIMCGSGQ